MSSVPPLPVQRSRGMRDLLPADMRAFRRVEDAFRAAATRWGYEEVRTPTIETYSLFTAAGALTPEMLSRVYSFLDWDGWSGERVVLRPDSTIPVARAAAEGSLGLPARLFYVQNVFRFSEADDREDWQCGIEYLGAPDAIGDLEVAAVAAETLDALGLKAQVRLSHVGIARAVADSVQASSRNGVATHGLAALRGSIADPQVAAFLEVALQPAGGLALLDNLAALAHSSVPASLPAIAELAGVAKALAGSGRAVVIDLGMPRDFDYYTGVVFEFESHGESWGGGGRYSPGGPGTASTACGLGLEAGMLASHLAPTTRERMVVAVTPAAPDDMGRAIAVARALHRGGIAAALSGEPGSSKLGVTVSGSSLVARTPDGERAMSALDDVVGLLIQYK
ncbi:MAG: ATP phosphoribosyltransferase regulatory subunit [Chloroflexi bacterium]|nr:ATP phosphoribosyltransferase regulatory subunit [Chloroflexota bacterium]